MSPRTALAAGLLAAGLATAGCGADVNLGDPSPSATAPAATPTAGPTATLPATTLPATTLPATTLPAPTTDVTTVAPTTGTGPAGALPATFPLPPGVTVRRVVTEAGVIAAALTAPDGKQAYAYWTSALPRSGYTVVGSQLVGGTGEIRFTGPGCPGDSRIGVNGTDVAVRCEQ